jgi:hypothetical protein
MKIVLLIFVLFFSPGCIHMIIPSIMLEANRMDKMKKLEDRVKEIERLQK